MEEENSRDDHRELSKVARILPRLLLVRLTFKRWPVWLTDLLVWRRIRRRLRSEGR